VVRGLEVLQPSTLRIELQGASLAPDWHLSHVVCTVLEGEEGVEGAKWYFSAERWARQLQYAGAGMLLRSIALFGQNGTLCTRPVRVAVDTRCSTTAWKMINYQLLLPTSATAATSDSRILVLTAVDNCIVIATLAAGGLMLHMAFQHGCPAAEPQAAPTKASCLTLSRSSRQM
jgi:hypothetical protein